MLIVVFDELLEAAGASVIVVIVPRLLIVVCIWLVILDSFLRQSVVKSEVSARVGLLSPYENNCNWPSELSQRHSTLVVYWPRDIVERTATMIWYPPIPNDQAGDWRFVGTSSPKANGLMKTLWPG